ncbi:hypothetical protein N0S44_000243 [Escherichia coli]|nr:hypothetical protein [Escherichia coli]EJR1979088.1 hypothetical protein [Escherichia coli]
MMSFITFTIICCITIIICRLIHVYSYHKALRIEQEIYIENQPKKKPPSPYGLKREMHSKSKEWGYAITKHGYIYTASNGYFQIHHNLDVAVKILWEMEDIGGYERTEFEFISNDTGTSPEA